MNDMNEFPIEEFTEDLDAAGQVFGTPQEVVARYTHCALCGAHLHFSHLTDFSKNLTQESARCPECGIRTRRVIHRLQ